MRSVDAVERDDGAEGFAQAGGGNSVHGWSQMLTVVSPKMRDLRSDKAGNFRRRVVPRMFEDQHAAVRQQTGVENLFDHAAAA